MANGIYERGEMYDILSGEAMFGELASHRPGIIISSEIGNQTSQFVTMVYCTTTTTTREISVNHRFTMKGIEQLALCSQIVTVSKKRLSKFYGKLSDSDMRVIDRCVKQALGFDNVDVAALKEKDREIEAKVAVIAEKDAEIAELKVKVAEIEVKVENAELSCKVENAMWQKLYEKALDQVVDMKYAHDLTNRTEKVPAPPKGAPVTKAPEPVESAPIEPADDGQTETPDDGRVDINHCTITELKKLGFSLSMAQRIVSHRPYNAVTDLKSMSGMKATQYRIMESKLCCTPMEPVVIVKDAPKAPEVSEKAESGKKVNINTASAGEIHIATGLTMTICYSITGTRKRDGLYKSVADLAGVKKFTPYHMKKYGSMFEV